MSPNPKTKELRLHTLTGWSDDKNLTPDRQRALAAGRAPESMPMQCQHWQSTHSLNAIPPYGGKQNSRCPHSAVTVVAFCDGGGEWQLHVCRAHADQMRREQAKALRRRQP